MGISIFACIVVKIGLPPNFDSKFAGSAVSRDDILPFSLPSENPENPFLDSKVALSLPTDSVLANLCIEVR
jgi:hypothetical protein